MLRFHIPTCTPLKKSPPFFNLTLDCLLNLQEKYYQCIHFGARCKLEPKRVTHLGICFDLSFRHYGTAGSVSDPHRFYADPDPDPAFLLNADPDPAFLLNADPDPTCRI
jgi:hypothetical protein